MNEEVRWLSDDEQYAWRAYLRATAIISENLNRDLVRTHAISHNEYDILARLSEAPDRTLRMSALADVMVHSRSRLTHTVRRLEDKGLVVRTANEEDWRGVDCTLTKAGWDFVVEVAVTHVNSVRKHVVDKLGHDDFLRLGWLCTRLVDNPRDIR